MEIGGKNCREICNKINDVIVVHDLDGEIISVNDETSNFLGYSREQLLSMNLQQIISKKASQESSRIIKEIKEGENEVFESEMLTSDGKRVPVEVSSQYLPLNKKKLILSVARDITKREKAREFLELHRKAMESSMDGMAILNENQRYIYLNQSHAEVYGYDDPEDLIGKTWRFLYSDDEIERIEEEIFPILEEEGSWRGKATGKKKNGSSFPQELSLSRIEGEGYVCVVRDISEREEMKETEEFLKSLLSHNLKNKIQVIQGNLELLKENGLNKEQKRILENALEATKKENSIIRKVNKLRKANEEEIKPRNIKYVLEDTLNQFKELASQKNIEIRNKVQEDTHVLAGYLLNQVFTNLIENSIYHSNCSTIRTRKEEKGNRVSCIIEDDGVGIPYEEKEEIFEKSYTTDRVGEAGLGLFLTKKLVDIYDGEIEVMDSELGGARFDVKLKKPEK